MLNKLHSYSDNAKFGRRRTRVFSGFYLHLFFGTNNQTTSLVNLLLDREKIRTQTVPTNSYWKYTTLRGNKKFPLIHVVEI